MSNGSGLFSNQRPKIPHLTQGPGGLSGEVADLREDLGKVMARLAALAVEEWTNVAAADDDAIKTVIASSAAAASYSGAALNGAVGGGTMSPPRNITITTSANAHINAVGVVITGKDVDGKTLTETITLTDNGGVTDVGNKAFAKVTQIDVPAQGGGGGTLKFGFGTKIGLSNSIHLRNGVPSVLAEMMDGALIGGSVAAGNGTVYEQATYLDVATKGTNYVGQYAGGAAISDAVGPFTQFYPPRNIEVVLGVGGAAGTVTVTGTDYKGSVITEDFVFAAAGTEVGAKAFKTVTMVESDVDMVGTVDVKTGDGYGLPSAFASLVTQHISGTGIEAAASSDATTGLVVPTTTPNNTRDYSAIYTTQHSHSGGAGTFVSAAVGLPHGTYTPATVPNGAHDYVLYYEYDPTASDNP